MERYAAGGKYLKVGRSMYELSDHLGGLHNLLKVIENQQHLPAFEVLFEALDQGPTPGLPHTKGLRDLGYDQVVVTERSQVDEEYAVPEGVNHLGCRLQGEPRLTRTPR